MKEFMNKFGLNYTNDRNASPLDQLYSAMINGNINSVRNIIQSDTGHKVYTRGAIGDICIALSNLINDTRLAEEDKSKIIRSVEELMKLETNMDKADGQVILDEFARKNTAITKQATATLTKAKELNVKEKPSSQQQSVSLEPTITQNKIPVTIDSISDALVTDGASLLAFKEAVAKEERPRVASDASYDSGYGSSVDYTESSPRKRSTDSMSSSVSSSSTLTRSDSELSRATSTISTGSNDYGRHTRARAERRAEADKRRIEQDEKVRIENLVGAIRTGTYKAVQELLGKVSYKSTDKAKVLNSFNGKETESIKLKLDLVKTQLPGSKSKVEGPSR